jgi:hypothetical protein
LSYIYHLWLVFKSTAPEHQEALALEKKKVHIVKVGPGVLWSCGEKACSLYLSRSLAIELSLLLLEVIAVLLGVEYILNVFQDFR